MVKIAMCCQTPLIRTFAFRGAEWFCRECKSSYPLMNVERVDSTPELDRMKEENSSWLATAKKGFIPGGSRRQGCDKCRDGEFHIEHATDQEKTDSQNAYARIMATHEIEIIPKGGGVMAKSPAAKAIDLWVKSDEGKKSHDGSTLLSKDNVYLSNRLHAAFIAGWDACEEHQKEDN